jgi:DNA polymerase-3 subunit delta'
VPGFESIIDQDRPVRILTALLQNGTLPHALLFTGIEGVGKQTAAKALAMACNCQGDDSGCKPGIQKIPTNDRRGFSAQNTATGACGRCKSCRKIESGNHPDIIQIKPSGAFIKIAQIRELGRTLAMKPYEASTRVVIIRDAQAMNPAAGNAILKMLEEPPERTILILTATQTFDLLPTIVSRCQHIRFNPISKKMLGNVLAAEHGLDRTDAMAIAAMAGGSFSRALTMCRSNWLQRRNWILKEMKFLSSQPIGRIIAFAERITKNKETLADILEVIKSWLRDLIVAKYCPAKILNQDMAQDINLLSQQLEVRSLLSIMETVQATQNRIYANTNLRLTMEVMLLKIARSVGE